MPLWLGVVSYVSVALGFLTAGIIVTDVIAKPQRMSIMNIVCPVTGLYFPVIGLWLYHNMGRPMAVESSPVKTDHPFWKSIFLSATHCGAGCVLGDIIGAPIVFALGWALGAEYMIEFALAYCFGIAFQYLPIRSMRKVSPYEALVAAVKADTLAVAAFEVGLFGWMALVYFFLMPAHRPAPTAIVFWFMMQIGMILGFITTYPANWLIVRWGVKSGM